jgi:two-component system, response regulator FlrC
MPTRRHTILIVEDEEAQNELLRLVLESEGYRAVGVSDGETAIHLLRQVSKVGDHFCTIVLDLALPRLNGLGVLHYLREHDQEVPVIAMSAYHRLLPAAATAGARATLSKPYDLDVLLSEVDRHCARAHD